MNLHVGVLHFTPGLEPFPLLAEPLQYTPETFDIVGNPADRRYWLGVLRDSIPGVVDKAAVSEQRTPGKLDTLACPAQLVQHFHTESAAKVLSTTLSGEGKRLFSDLPPAGRRVLRARAHTHIGRPLQPVA